MRRLGRNSCAHNERVYCLTHDKNKNDQHSGRTIGDERVNRRYADPAIYGYNTITGKGIYGGQVHVPFTIVRSNPMTVSVKAVKIKYNTRSGKPWLPETD